MEKNIMARFRRCLILVSSVVMLAACQTAWQPSSAPGGSSGVERLYILNCGEGVTTDLSRWTPGMNVGQSMDFVDSCYLIKHRQAWLLWDTGVADSIAAMPEGQRPADPRAVHWRRPKTLAAQLEQLGLKPADIKYVALSHSHPDHSGNLAMFPQATLLVQKAEVDWPTPTGPRFKPEPAVSPIEGDRDVFGDGSVTLVATPGHTPGHQSLLVRLPKTGAVLLSGDAVHFKDNWDKRRVPDINSNKEQTSASMQRLADILAREGAQLWINHDKAQRERQKLAPEFYE
jgi:N-acyl homoserine lactone hydrolase